MTTQDDVAMIRKMIEPLAAKAGLFRGRVLGMINEENIRAMYSAVGEKGVRDAADAIVRVGKVSVPASGPGTQTARNRPG